ncbi:unnamed protein product [Paramecium pentaurelia]|uniref:Uncharacterized protein n=1 Tax=Paramecium pentaurelia TaxID=43138 RepID=A0A8S1VFM5_9CILI|nr:unnamed protein product [Paramecium pentaurelia]
MKILLIPAALYFIITGWFLLTDSKLPYYPFQHVFYLIPYPLIQSLVIILLGICVFLDQKRLLCIFMLLAISDMIIILYQAYSLYMQELSEALNHVGYKCFLLGIILESMRNNVEQQISKQK